MIKTLESVYICSVCPIPLPPVTLAFGVEDRPTGGRSTVFRLPIVGRGEKPYLLEVTDMWESIPDPMNLNARGRCTMQSKIEECKNIAADLVKQWTSNMPYHGRLGVAVIAGSEPTPEELQDLYDQQSLCLEEIFHEAELLARKDKVDAIRKIHRATAEYLQRPRSWSTGEASQNVGRCPFCFGDIDVRASICRHCRMQIKSLPEESTVVPPPTAPKPPDLSVYSAPPEPFLKDGIEEERELVGAGVSTAPQRSAPGKPVPSIPVPTKR